VLPSCTALCRKYNEESFRKQVAAFNEKKRRREEKKKWVVWSGCLKQ
jgi:hypothetical protein